MAVVPLLLSLLLASAHGVESKSCKCLPGDSCWPSAAAWSELNATVGGHLFDIIPPAAACFESYNGIATLDIVKCNDAKTNWAVARWTSDQQVQTMWPFWSNYSCLPTVGTGCSLTCGPGLLSQQVVIAQTPADIQASVNFAREKNLRLVIRNTGHCMMGRSTGFGSLAINTHEMRSIEWIQSYTGPGDWHGSAVKVAAGAMLHEVYKGAFAQEPKVDVVGGECPPERWYCCGYIQGGGHSPLSGIYGLASDSALSFDVVIASGELVTADASNNADLFWALKGGGMGTWGVVTSLTVKTYPTVPCVGMSLNITGEGETFWKGYSAFHRRSPQFVDAGMYVWYAMTNGNLKVLPFVAPNLTVAGFTAVVQPLLDELTASNVPFSASPIILYPNFNTLYTSLFGLTSESSGSTSILGGRLFSRTDVRSSSPAIVSAVQNLLSNGAAVVGGHLVNPGNRNPDPNSTISSAHPVWRDTADSALWIVSGDQCQTIEQRTALQHKVSNVLGKSVRDITPTSATYVNDGDINEPQWQDTLWGTNYPKLLAIKEKWDPEGLFYSKSTPGAEKWVLEGETRLCKAA